MSQTTFIMPEVLTNDIVSSQTLMPTIPRETFASPPSLGYHYSVVDYVVNGTSVNNCTLNIDQGAVLAFTAPSSFPTTRPFAAVGWKDVFWANPLRFVPIKPLFNDFDGGYTGPNSHPQFDGGTQAGDYSYSRFQDPSEGILDQFIHYRSQFIAHWSGFATISPEPLKDALHDAFTETQDVPVPVAYDRRQGLMIYGFPSLMWNKCNSPDWRLGFP
jgi:hypothetical protein